MYNLFFDLASSLQWRSIHIWWRKYHGEIVKDHYGRQIPKHAHGTINLERYTSSTKQIMDAAGELFDRIIDKDLLIRRLNITATHVIDEASAPSSKDSYEQLDITSSCIS